MTGMDEAKLGQLKGFVKLIEANPAVLADPSLEFFRDYLESLNAELPPEVYGIGTKGAAAAEKEESSEAEVNEQPAAEEGSVPTVEEVEEEVEAEEAEIVESDVEIDNEGVVEPDSDEPQPMGDASKEVTEEQRDAAQAAKATAVEALEKDDFDTAIKYFTEAILNNPTSSILYGNRARVFVRMKKPNAAIRDCDEALKLNPDSARALKSRGEARALLGDWQAAAADLRLASSLDYDEEVAEFLKQVEPKVHRLEEHRRKYERLRSERAERVAAKERQRKKKQAEAAYAQEKRREADSQARKPRGMPNFPGGMPAGMGFGGGAPGGGAGAGGGMPDISSLLSDPELLAAMQNPEVMAAMQDVMSNPSNLLKYQNDPKVGPILMKLMAKFSSAGGAPV